MKEAKKIETLRREFQDARATAQPQGACPDAESIWDAATGDLPAEERREIVSHLGSCADCTHSWRLAWAMQAEMRDEGGKTDTQSTYGVVVLNRWKRFAPQVAAAALLVFALGVGVMWNQPEPVDRTPAVRGATVEHEIESLLPEGEGLPREEFVLRWEFPKQGVTYDLRVMTSDLRSTLHEAHGIQSKSYQVPEEKLSNVASERDVVWSVRVRSADGMFLDERIFRTPLR